MYTLHKIVHQTLFNLKISLAGQKYLFCWRLLPEEKGKERLKERRPDNMTKVDF